MATKNKLTPLKKKLWALFSEYIRKKYSDTNGYCPCYTCGVVMNWKKLQCGHLLDGRNNAILFCEEAVRPQCAGCNLFKNGNKESFIPKFIDEMGREKYDELRRLKNTTVKYSVSDLEELIETYKQKIKELG